MSQLMPRLNISEGLCKAADKRAEELAVTFSETRPNGGSLSSLFIECGEPLSSYSYTYTAVETEGNAVYRDILDAKTSSFDSKIYNKIGVGHYHDPYSQYGDYWVVFVGR